MTEAEEESFLQIVEQHQQQQQQEQQQAAVSSSTTASLEAEAADTSNQTPSQSLTERFLLRSLATARPEELCVLQEQISEYMEVKSFKRKYPDINRRFPDVLERRFLKEARAVSETQCDLGLNVLCLGDVLELMANAADQSAKYAELAAFLAERRRKALTAVKHAWVI